MNFISFFFGYFLIISVIIYWLTPIKYRPVFLTLTSLLAVGLSSYQSFILMLSIALIVYFIYRFNYLGWIIAFLTVLGSLVIFKYTPFIINNINKIGFNFIIPKLIFPLGISFFTFKLLAFLIDWRRGNLSDRKINIIDYLLNLFFYPSFISGPINRYPLIANNNLLISDISYSIQRIVSGYLKKLYLAGLLIPYYNPLFSKNGTSLKYLLAAYAYSLYIYLDFSGYSDIAIGSGRLFGINLPENFNFPYLRENVSKFWKNWHMSLTSWFGNYVFIPLGGSRVKFKRIILNTFIVMLLTGIWHGAGWNFILWGIYHFIGLAFWRLWNRISNNINIINTIRETKIFRYFSIFITFNFVTVGWILFATPTRQGLHVIKTILIGWW